jgi:excinuclease ABC subunit B
LYSRSEAEFKHGNFRVKGDTVDIFLAYGDIAYRIVFWGDEIEEISSMDPLTGQVTGQFEEVVFILPIYL